MLSDGGWSGSSGSAAFFHPPSDPVKILLLKPSSLGDVVHAFPVVRSLKRKWPDAELHWWIDSGLAALVETDPDVAGVFRFERKRWARPGGWPSMFAAIRRLREQRFDLVVDLQGLARSAAFAWMANGTFTIGVDDPREGAGALYDVAVPRPSAQTHAVDWYLEVVRRLGVTPHAELPWLAPRPLVAAGLESRLGMSQRRWILLNPGARWWNKRWPAASFREALRRLATFYPRHHFAILGGREDAEMATEILPGAPDRTINLAGSTNLGELVEIIRAAELIVTNDTGPMHIAAALGTPMIALFGPTNPNRTGPYGRQADVLREPLACSPCLSQTCRNNVQMECMTSLSVDRVVAAALARIQP